MAEFKPIEYIVRIESNRKGTGVDVSLVKELVRCGECKWLFNDSNTFFKPCEVIIPEKDWYCAYGERREG